MELTGKEGIEKVRKIKKKKKKHVTERGMKHRNKEGQDVKLRERAGSKGGGDATLRETMNEN